jgi:hypothetical protein
VASSSVVSARAIVDREGRRWTTDELFAQVRLAQNGDPAALAMLETTFRASQWWWPVIGGDVARDAEDELVRASSTSEFGRLAVRKTLERTRDELAGPCPSPLVGLAARRVAMCKLEADLAHRSSANSISRNLVPTEAEQRWLDRADARYRKAIKTLADLQRLQLPVVQLNVGGQQVNIATDQLNLPGLAGAAGPTTPAAVSLPALAASSSSVGALKRARPRGGRKPVEEAAVEPGDGEPIPSDPSGPPPSTPDAAATAECPTSPSSEPSDPYGGSLPPLAAPTARRGQVERHAGEPEEVPLLGPGAQVTRRRGTRAPPDPRG